MISLPSVLKFFRYFLSACAGLIIDLTVFSIASQFYTAALSQVISYSTGMLSTFTLQKYFVFQQNRRTHHAFGLALMLWLIGLGLSTVFIDWLVNFEVLATYPLLAKLIVINFTFWYNFFSRKFAFRD